ncbi:MAG TPA: tail fiber domain-containing protein, partial [Bacteroidales bacterium]|nr:tail fiber domain-containing protein [Bacteroidales bacterium]
GGRKAYFGFPGAAINNLSIVNEIGDGNIAMSVANNGDITMTTAAYGNIVATTGTDGDIVLNPNGSVGINNSSPSFKLDVTGTMRVTGALNFTDPFTHTLYSAPRNLMVTSAGEVGGINGSSIRFKENVFDLVNYDWLFRLRPVIYNYKNSDPADIQYGMIAEETDKVNSLLVIYKDNQPEGIMYERLTVPMLKAIQDQKKEIDDLKATVERLEKLVEQLSKEK